MKEKRTGKISRREQWRVFPIIHASPWQLQHLISIHKSYKVADISINFTKWQKTVKCVTVFHWTRWCLIRSRGSSSQKAKFRGETRCVSRNELTRKAISIARGWVSVNFAVSTWEPAQKCYRIPVLASRDFSSAGPKITAHAWQQLQFYSHARRLLPSHKPCQAKNLC